MIYSIIEDILLILQTLIICLYIKINKIDIKSLNKFLILSIISYIVYEIFAVVNLICWGGDVLNIAWIIASFVLPVVAWNVCFSYYGVVVLKKRNKEMDEECKNDAKESD